MFVEFFVLGGVFFWILLILFVIGMFSVVEHDNWGAGVAATIVVFLLLMLFGDLWQVLKGHPWLTLIALAGYIVAGPVWTVPRWWLLMRRISMEFNELKADFWARHDLEPGDTLPAELREAWADDVRWKFGRYGMVFDPATGSIRPPTFPENRDRILTWAAFWPFSMIWTVIREGVIAVMETLVDWWKTIYQKISDMFFKDIM